MSTHVKMSNCWKSHVAAHTCVRGDSQCHKKYTDAILILKLRIKLGTYSLSEYNMYKQLTPCSLVCKLRLPHRCDVRQRLSTASYTRSIRSCTSYRHWYERKGLLAWVKSVPVSCKQQNVPISQIYKYR